MLDFTGKTVIVTGSSAGIGQEAVLIFAKQGANVVVHGQSTEKLEKVVQRLKSLGVPESRILVVQGAVQDEDVRKKLINDTIATFGRLDVLVNNAGVSHRSDLDPNDFQNLDFVMEVNLKAAMQLTELALPHLEKTKGNIVNVSSTGAKKIYLRYSHYCLAKAALNHFTRAAAVGNAIKGVRVNTVTPGGTVTDFVSRHYGNNELSDHIYKKEAVASIPMGRAAQPEEVANAIVFLASAEAGYITGVDLAVDGGRLSQCVG